MFNRINVTHPSGSGGGGFVAIGTASGASGMICKFHSTVGGSGGAAGLITPTDAFVIQSITDDVVSARTQLGNQLYTEYAFNAFVASNDEILTQTGAQNWPTGTSPLHFPFGL